MKNNTKKKLLISFITIGVICISLNTYAHSGRTDKNGGHKDNQNKSGLGSYHYHCGGNPPHLHSDGVCPYSSSKKSTSSSSSSKASSSKSSSSSSTKTTSTQPTTVIATGIQINEKVESLEVGEGKVLTATIEPSNVTDKSITWKSSDESIAIVTSSGQVIAKESGNVEITATTSNGKTSTLTIKVKEKPKVENTIITRTSTITGSNTLNNPTSNNEEDVSGVGGILGLALLGGGGYWGYKKYKKS